LVKASDGWTFDEGGAGTMNLFPEATEGRGGIKGGGGQFGMAARGFGLWIHGDS
jgi:hypothetical protein